MKTDLCVHSCPAGANKTMVSVDSLSDGDVVDIIGGKGGVLFARGAVVRVRDGVRYLSVGGRLIPSALCSNSIYKAE